MSPAADRDHRDPTPEGDAYVRQQLASIDGSLFNGMPADDRFESGVPETQRGNSLDFIQMTGLTRPPLRQALHSMEGALAHTPIYEDLNPQGPLSFYEKGVADVDDTLGADALLGGLRDITLDADLIPNRHTESLVSESGPSRSAQAFRDIVAGLQRAEQTPETESPGEEAPEETVDQAPEPGDYHGSTSGALLALVEELESVMGVQAPESPEATAPADAASGEDDTPDRDPEPESVETPEENATAPLLSAPAAEIDDADFDALLASLSGSSDDPSPESVESPELDLAGLEPEEAIAPEPASQEDDTPAPGSDIADDWDALLDSMTVRGAEVAPITESAPMVPRTPQASGALAEAEQLMQALEKRPAANPPAAPAPPVPVVVPAAIATAYPDPTPSIDTTFGAAQAPPGTRELQMRDQATVPDVTEPVSPLPGAAEGDGGFNYDYSASPTRRRSRRHSRVARKSRKIIKAAFFLLLICALAGTLWTFVIAPMMLRDEDLAVRAEREMTEQNYASAARTYIQLAARMAPGERERSDVEFRAAHALTLGPATSWDETRQRYELALSLFKKFTEDYPQHPKRTRALSIMGRLHYELKDFEQAIIVLRDLVKPAEDPAAALSMLRYLARSYSMTGNYDQAETSYLQAATLPGNYSAESDYLELGDLYRRRAEAAKEGADQEKMKEMAMSYWRRAIQVPGIAPGDRSNLEERLQWLSFAEQSDANASADAATATATESPDLSNAPAPPAEPQAVAPAESSIPVPQDETGRAETPGAELEALVPPTPAPEATQPAPAPAQESQSQ